MNKNVSYRVTRHATLEGIKCIILCRHRLIPSGPRCWILEPVRTPNNLRIINRSFVLRFCSSIADTPINITQRYRSKKHPDGNPMIASKQPVPGHNVQNRANGFTAIMKTASIPTYIPGNREQVLRNQYLNPGYSSYRHFQGGTYLPLYDFPFGSAALGWNRALPREANDRLDIQAVLYPIDLTDAFSVSYFRTLDEFRDYITWQGDFHTAETLERHVQGKEPLNWTRGDAVCVLERLSYYIGPLEEENDANYRSTFLAAHRSLTSNNPIFRPGHVRRIDATQVESIEMLMTMIISKVEDMGWDPLPRSRIRKACEALCGIPGVTAIDCLLWMADHPADSVDEKDPGCNGTASRDREYHTEEDPHPSVVALNAVIANLELRGELGKCHTIRTEDDFDHFKAILFRLDPDTHKPTACKVTGHPRGFDRWPQFDLELRIVTKNFQTVEEAYSWSRATHHHSNGNSSGYPSQQRRKRGREENPAEIKGYWSPRKKLCRSISLHPLPSTTLLSTVSPVKVALSTPSPSTTALARGPPGNTWSEVNEVFAINEDEENPAEMAIVIQASLEQLWQTGPKRRVSHMPVRSVSNNDEDETEKAVALSLELCGEEDEMKKAIALSLELREEEDEMEKAIALSLELNGMDACPKEA